MEKKQSEFNKVFSAWDILVIAFGAMIGWGWVVSSGGWIQKGGVLGAALGFVVGGVMIFFVGLTYAELTAAMPQCGGEHVWSHRAMGPTGSFVCTWAIILGYVGVAVLMSGFMGGMYCIPGSGGTLILPEWGMVAAWSALGVVFFAICKSKYRESFGSMVQLISDEDAATLLPEADERELDKVIDGAIDRVLARLA